MTRWRKVKWSRAGQVIDEDFVAQAAPFAPPAGDQPPALYFDDLRTAGALDLAALFLARALPRLEAAAWAARSVRDLAPPAAPADAAALRAALMWLADTTEPRRRAAFAAAEACGASPARLAALAVFFSGGSIAPEDCEPVHAPRDTTAQMAAGAVLLACGAAADPDAALLAALSAGEVLADQGLNGAAA